MKVTEKEILFSKQDKKDTRSRKDLSLLVVVQTQLQGQVLP